MKRSSVLSRTFFRRPAVRELVPDLKLVLLALTIGCETHSGVYVPSGLSEDVGLDPGALVGALDDLKKRGHTIIDNATGEVFITAWYRDNKFSTPQRRRQWADDFARIESNLLRSAVLTAAAASDCGLSVEKTSLSIKINHLLAKGKGKGKGNLPDADSGKLLPIPSWLGLPRYYSLQPLAKAEARLKQAKTASIRRASSHSRHTLPKGDRDFSVARPHEAASREFRAAVELLSGFLSFFDCTQNKVAAALWTG